MTTRVTPSSSSQPTTEISEAAKNWTKCLERFKIAIDSLYEICRETHNFAGCREVLLYLGNATHAFESLIVMIDVEQSWEKDPTCKPLAWEIKPSSGVKQQEQEEIWHVVHGRRRKNTLSSEESSENNESRSSEKENKKTNVYERLAYGLRRPVRPFSPEIITTDPDATPGSNLMCPRSAMDLPQTKASMAKMAYSRERLWKGRVKPLLEEKLSTIQRRQARLTYSQVAKQPPKQKSESDPNRSREPSLASISETAEENDDNLSTVTMAEQAGLNSDKILAELGGDDQWLAMTMEEESLAQEEESLQKEILEEERSSIDDEFEREACKQFGKIRYKKSWKDVIANWTQQNDTVSPEQLVYRKPGDAVQMHEKLLSPSRKRTQTDFEKRLEERQQRALELRQRLLDEKANRLKELHAKVEEIRQKRIEVEEKKRALLEEKMEKVNEKREKNLAEVVKRARDDDLRIQEVQLIKTLENMSLKSEIQSKEEERQEKLRFLAQKQAKKAEENAAKHAQVEENRVAKMQRDAEKLLEQTEKSSARLQNAAANRSELLEGMRKKQRKLTEKIDRLKVIETQTSQNLIDQIQSKLEKAEKLYEETILNTKQRAAELSSPRPLACCSAMILSECLQPPISLEDNNGKKCSACKIKIHSTLHALAHVCTSEHLKNRNSDKMELNFEEVKQELENFIILLTDGDDTDIKDIISTTTTVPSNESSSKKKRTKLKQKLLKDIEPLSTTLVTTGIIEKGIYRIIKELETQIQAICKASSLTDSTRNHVEKLFAQFDKQIFEIRDEKEKENNFSRIISSTNILELMLKLMALGDFCESINRPATKRLYLKSCAFLACLFSPTKVAETIFTSKCFIDLAELLISSMKISADSNINFEQGISTLYILYQLGLAISAKDPTPKIKQKLSHLTAFLISHGFIDFIKAVLIAVSKFSILDKLELSTHSCIGIIETISGFINLVLRQIPDGQECHDPFHHLFQTYFTISTNFLFHALPREEEEDSCPTSPIQWTENEELVTRNFFVSFSREFIRLTPNPKTVIFLKQFISKDDYQNGLRITFILNGIIQKRISKISSFEELPPMAYRVSAYFASTDDVLQRFCLVGWQHSLLLTLCRTCFDNLFDGNSHDLRYSILMAIFSIVRKSKVAIEAMETEIGVSWLRIFLEHLIKGRIKETPETRSLLPTSIREEYFNFYRSLL